MNKRSIRAIITGVFIIFSMALAISVENNCDYYESASKVWLLVFVLYLFGLLVTFKLKK